MSMIGKCPYDDCDEMQWRLLPEETPVLGKDTCEGCGRLVWVYYSRLDPKVYTENDFHKEWRLNEETKTVTPLR